MGTHPIFESDFDCLTDMTTLSRESRTSLDSGFADELRSRFSRSKSKMKQKRKFNKTDISNPLGDVKHLYHIGSSGQSFGDMSADMSKAMSDFGKGSTTESMPSSLTPSFSLKSERTNFDSDDAVSETRFEDYIKEPVNRRSVNQPSLVETC